jgi:hypothetical protein
LNKFLKVPSVVAYMQTKGVSHSTVFVKVKLLEVIPAISPWVNVNRLVNLESANWMRKAPAAKDHVDLNRAVGYVRNAIDLKSQYFNAELYNAPHVHAQQSNGRGTSTTRSLITSASVAKVNASSSAQALPALACVPTSPAVATAPVAASVFADFSIERFLALEKSVAYINKIVHNPSYHGMAPQMGHPYGSPMGMGMGPQPPYPYGSMHHGGFDPRQGPASSAADGSADSQDTAGVLTVSARGGWPPSWGQLLPSGP